MQRQRFFFGGESLSIKIVFTFNGAGKAAVLEGRDRQRVKLNGKAMLLWIKRSGSARTALRRLRNYLIFVGDKQYVSVQKKCEYWLKIYRVQGYILD